MPSEVQTNFRFGISFYLIAMLFILFDIEVIFLYPGRRPAEGVRHLRARGDDRLHRAAVRRLRLRLAPRSARVEIIRAEGSAPARRRRASAPASCAPATCSAASSRATSSSSTSRSACSRRRSTRPPTGRAATRSSRSAFGLACCAIEMMSHRRRAHGHRALRLRGLPRLAAPGRHDHPVGPRLDQDGADHPAPLRPDARAEVRDRDGRVLLARWACSTTTRSSRPTSSCRSTCTCPAARRGPRRSCTASSSCAKMIQDDPAMGWRNRYGARGTEEVVADGELGNGVKRPRRRGGHECLTRPGLELIAAGARGEAHDDAVLGTDVLPRPGRAPGARPSVDPRRARARCAARATTFLASVHGVDYYPEEPRLGVHYELLDMGARRPHRASSCACPPTRPSVADGHRRLADGRPPGARGLRHVRRGLRRPPRPAPHPHARGLRGPPAAPRLPDRRRAHALHAQRAATTTRAAWT